MQGEDLHVLSVPDLLVLEQQLDLGASKVRARKVIMFLKTTVTQSPFLINELS